MTRDELLFKIIVAENAINIGSSDGHFERIASGFDTLRDLYRLVGSVEAGEDAKALDAERIRRTIETGKTSEQRERAGMGKAWFTGIFNIKSDYCN